MKEILALLLVAVMCFSLVACGGTPLANQNTGGLAPENAGSAGDDAQPDDLSKFIPYLCGEWHVLHVED